MMGVGVIEVGNPTRFLVEYDPKRGIVLHIRRTDGRAREPSTIMWEVTGGSSLTRFEVGKPVPAAVLAVHD